jgi:AraC-like DNA-binding protein
MDGIRMNAHKFYEENGITSPCTLFDLLSDIFYFAKNKEGEFVCANKLLQEKFNLESPNDAIGKTDFDFFSQDIAKRIRADDLMVMSNDVTVRNKFEVVAGAEGKLYWLFTTKSPIKNKYGEIVGVEGFSRDAERSQNIIEPYHVFKRCIEHMQSEFMNELSIEYLASLSFMSLSTFERKFKKQFSQTPTQYIKKLRMHQACNLLASGMSIKRAAIESGFCDQSYFSKEFKSMVGITPRQYALATQSHKHSDRKLEDTETTVGAPEFNASFAA